MKANPHYLDLRGSYLFSTIGKKVAAYQKENPDKTIIRLGIGDVTQPLTPSIIEALHKATDEMAHAETFRGYARILDMTFSEMLFPRTIIKSAAVILLLMKYLFRTAQRVIPEIFRKYLPLTALLLSLTLCTRYM